MQYGDQGIAAILFWLMSPSAKLAYPEFVPVESFQSIIDLNEQFPVPVREG